MQAPCGFFEKKPKDFDRYYKIWLALRLKNMCFADIARMLGISGAAVSYFSYGQLASQRFDDWVKENLGVVI